MATRPRSRPLSGPRPRASRITSGVVALALVVTGCTVSSGGPADGAGSAAAPTPGPTTGPEGDLVVVLPPADVLAEPERVRLRRLVEDVLARRTRAGDAAAVAVLEPATAASLADTLDIAARRVGGDGTVCLLGARGRPALATTLGRYPAARACIVPGPVPSGVTADRVVAGDVDLAALGRALGLAARTAAGDGAVLLLDGGDPLLDVRLRRGVEEAVLGVAGTSGPALGVVRTAAEAIVLLDEQAALDGTEPGGGAGATDDRTGPSPAERDGLPASEVPPTARSLRRIGVVILDASAESASLAVSLAGRGVGVVVPSSLLEEGFVAPEQVVLHWRVRWDVPFAAALAPSPSGADEVPPSDPVVLVPGPAAPTP